MSTDKLVKIIENKCNIGGCEFDVSKHDSEEKHCIFHCQKNDHWSIEKNKIFWKEIKERQIRDSYGNLVFRKYIFPNMGNIIDDLEISEDESLRFEGVTFKDKVIFNGIKNGSFKIKNLVIQESYFEKGLELISVRFENLHISFYEMGYLRLSNIYINERFSLYNYNDERIIVRGIEHIKECEVIELTNLDLNLEFFKLNKITKIRLQNILLKGYLKNNYETSKEQFSEVFGIFLDKVKNGVIVPNNVFLTDILVTDFVGKIKLLEEINLNGLIFLKKVTSKDGMKEWKCHDEIYFEDRKDNTELRCKNIEDTYMFLQNYYSEKGEISQSAKLAEGKFRVAKKRINEFTDNEFDKMVELEFLYAEMKKRYDDLSLYSEAEEFFVQEMDIKKDKLKQKIKDSSLGRFSFILSLVILGISGVLTYIFFKEGDIFYNSRTFLSFTLILLPIFYIPFSYFISKGIYYLRDRDNKTNDENLSILSIYKIISYYNTSPVTALKNLFFTIVIFFVVFLIVFGEFNWEFTLRLLDYSVANSIPFVDTIKIDNILDNFNQLKVHDWSENSVKVFYEFYFKFYSYLEKIISAGIILLFGLSLRRKFKR